MSLTKSNMLALGSKAPDFSLPSTDGGTVSLDTVKDAQLVVVLFICNHCPYVIHIAPALSRLAAEYLQKDVAFVAINSNDAQSHPDDSFEMMQVEKQTRDYPFPYLFDETQAVAKAYQAACTPDIFVFDQQRALVYRGQFDDTRPGGKPASGVDLRHALDSLLAGEALSDEQKPSMGCNIKWKPGNAPG